MEQITCDLIPGGKMPLLHASQYDEGREYRINLTENKQAYTLDGTELLTVSVRKGDNTLFTADIANTFGGKSYVDFVSTEQMCACAGFSFGELSITKNNTRIGTINFTLMVEPSPEEGGVSQSEINNLARQVEELVDDEMGDYLLKTEAEETYATITDLETLSGVVDTKANESDLETLAGVVDTKASKTYVDTELNKKADTSSLATVATSGSYNDLTDKPTIPEQVQSDWSEADNTKADYIKNKPNLANVATTGNYDDLNNKPTIPVIDDTTKVTDKVWSSKKTFDEIVNILPTGNASGSIANFNTSLALPMEIVADFNATQEAGTPTPSEPKAISGVSAVNVIHCGANLCDEVWEIGDISAETGASGSGTDRIRTKNYCPCKPSTEYYLVIPNKNLRFYFYDKNFNYIGFEGWWDYSRSYTTPNNAYYFKIGGSGAYGTTYNHDISLNYTSTDTTYHAYNGDTEVINLGGTYYGGYVTQDKNGKRELTITSVKKALTSSDINEVGVSTADIKYARTVLISGLLPTSQNLLSNEYVYYNGADRENTFRCLSSSTRLYFYNNNFTDLETARSLLSGVEVVYKLAEPITIELPDGDPITAFNGVNNVYADSGDCEVTYKKSIDDAIAELQALILS